MFKECPEYDWDICDIFKICLRYIRLNFASGMSLIYSMFALRMPEIYRRIPYICLIYDWNMPYICLRFTWFLPKMCLRLSDIWVIHTWDVPKILLKFFWNISEICMIYDRYIPTINFMFAWDIPEIFLRRCIWNIPLMSLK